MVEEGRVSGVEGVAGGSLMGPLGMAFWSLKAGFEREVGVSLGTWYTLRHLEGEPGMSQGELCRRFDLDPSRITRLAQRLGREGLIRRERDSGDSRVMRMYLTDAGRTMLVELDGEHRAFDAMIEDALEPEEMEKLKRSLTVVARAVKEARETKETKDGEG